MATISQFAPTFRITSLTDDRIAFLLPTVETNLIKHLYYFVGTYIVVGGVMWSSRGIFEKFLPAPLNFSAAELCGEVINIDNQTLEAFERTNPLKLPYIQNNKYHEPCEAAVDPLAAQETLVVESNAFTEMINNMEQAESEYVNRVVSANSTDLPTSEDLILNPRDAPDLIRNILRLTFYYRNYISKYPDGVPSWLSTYLTGMYETILKQRESLVLSHLEDGDVKIRMVKLSENKHNFDDIRIDDREDINMPPPSDKGDDSEYTLNAAAAAPGVVMDHFTVQTTYSQ